MKTFLPSDPGQNRAWYLVDATDKTLGRLAVRIANTLRGRQKPTFTPQIDTGDFVVVVNAGKVKLTGNKSETKTYKRYTGYWSGLKEVKAGTLRQNHPEKMIALAVKGMLPDNKQSRKMMTRLKVYAGESHPHAAQKLQQLDVK
jgi:large subunit ribosomal protein L13